LKFSFVRFFSGFLHLSASSEPAHIQIFRRIPFLWLNSYFTVYRLEQMKPTEHMRIDSRALVGLNLLEDPSQPGHSVFDILNRTRTAGGCRLLKSWLKQPLIQVSAFF
jgi:hypothetical protein